VAVVLTRQFCQLTRDGEVYHDYCLNYSKAVNYLDQLRKNEDFCEFMKVSDWQHDHISDPASTNGSVETNYHQ